ncbi:class I SAM-dependent methyltransferase [Chloroflexota bacterium]
MLVDMYRDLILSLGRISWGFRQKVFYLLFLVLQRVGIHITRNRFYSPIPDTRALSPELWLRESKLVGVNLAEQGQLELLRCFSSVFKEEYEKLPRRKSSIPHQYYLYNESFGPVDGEILYCMIRHFKPKRMVEIGSGFSTFLTSQAIVKNEEESKEKVELAAIEPYPNVVLRRGFPGLTRLITEKVENVELAEFNRLEENDILFIDSSHVLKTGNDVYYEYLEILPSLNRGVIVHIHDIFLPLEYPEQWVRKWRLFWNEQYLLQAFLAFNTSYEVLWAATYMHLKHPKELEEAFSSYRRQPGYPIWSRGQVWPGSFWIRKKV